MSEFLTEKELVLQAAVNNGVDTGKKPVRVTSGFPGIDDALGGGISPGEMFVVASAPNVIKTTAMLHMMRAADRDGHRCLYVSCEDSETVIGERLQAFYTSIQALEFRSEAYRDRSLWDKLQRAKFAMRQSTFTFPTEPTVEGIDRAVQAYRPTAVYVDYFTAIQVGKSDRASYSVVVNQLDVMSKVRNVAVYLACQIRRPQWDSKAAQYAKEPQLHELGETSFLEQRAEAVMLLWKDAESVRYCRLAKNKFSGELPRYRVILTEQGLLRTVPYNPPEEAEKPQVSQMIPRMLTPVPARGI